MTSILGDLDLHLLGEGRHERLWLHLGAHPGQGPSGEGTSFAVWAPNARTVSVVGDFNQWDGDAEPMAQLGSSGVWTAFVAGVGHGARYKYAVVGADGVLRLKADPFAFATEAPPATASVVHSSSYEWGDASWLERRAATEPQTRPLSVYECHLGSWRRHPEQPDRSLTYRELAAQLPAYVAEMGFTHVELLPVAEHPFAGSWGYQVSAYYAPTARFGSPDDFRALVEAFHAHGVGVIVDWVPAHFPKDEFALAYFDGTALYEHADPRRGEHPDWGTLIFNLGRNEVRNFLIANALYWIEELHVDGLRVDAVASMLYLDYSRAQDDWVPNRFGGREDLEAVEFLKELNEVVYGRHPGVMMVAEESTAWPAVSRPTYAGGLGFGFKWNMGWMHDTLEYFSADPLFRRHHHGQLTFGLHYAFSENFILPLSHDEAVHGKGSLVTKMPGEGPERLAHLRSLLGWMWAHPGSQLLFMGGELAQEQEWSHDRGLDWHLLEDPGHRSVQSLVRVLNRLAVGEPALWEAQYEASGFSWIDASAVDQNVVSFARYSRDRRRCLVCAANLSGTEQRSYRIGLPHPGTWTQVLDTNADDAGERVPREAEKEPWHGQNQSIQLDLGGPAVIWLSWTEAAST